MKRLILIFLIALAIVLPAAAQSPPSLLGRQLSLVLADPPPQVGNMSTTIVGTAGGTQYFYWIVANGTIGQGDPTGPFAVLTANATLSGGNYVRLNWTTVSGAVSYDVLRTNTPTKPSGVCNCAVNTGITSGTTNDQSNSLNSYTVNPANLLSFTYVISTRSVSTGLAQLVESSINGGALYLPGIATPGTLNDCVKLAANGIDLVDAGAACSAASGTVTSFSAGNLSPLFTTSVATATTTPALTFTLSNVTGPVLYGKASGTGAPAFFQPSCSILADAGSGCSGSAGANTALSNLASVAIITPLLITNGTAGAPSYTFTGHPTDGLWSRAATTINLAANSTDMFECQTSFCGVGNGSPITWSPSSPFNADTGVYRAAPGSLYMTAGASSTFLTTSIFKAGVLQAIHLQGVGTAPTVANVGANSCGTTAATLAGTSISGVITVGATAGTQCRVTFPVAAPTARDCTVTDSTTTIATRATYVDTSNTDFLGAFVAGDNVSYVCAVR